MPIKTFRGKIADNEIDTVVLHTNDGSTGYRVKQLQIISEAPYDVANAEHVIKIYKVLPPLGIATSTVDMNDPTLLGVAITNNSTAGYQWFQGQQIIFDSEIFNQDIYITHVDAQGAQACNYYIELEQMPLDLSENTVATLKDIRNNDQV